MKLGLLYIRTKSYDQGHTLGPNGVGYLASYAEERLGITDSYIEFYFDKLMEQRPDVVGLSSVSETYPLAIEMAKEIKKINPKLPVIIGGAHITAVPESLHPAMDVGVISEGEAQFGDILELMMKKELNPDTLRDIQGICFHDGNGGITDTGKREWIDNLDIIPPPKRSAIAKIHLRSDDFPIHQSLMTNRGCPFKCTFCSAVALWERTRYHSLERVMFEIEDIIRNYPHQKMIPITDDLFALHKKRLKQMIDMMRSEKLLGRVQYTCHARASCFDEETAALMAEMGVKVACFGFESGNDRMLKHLKGGSKARDNQRAIDLCNKYNISVLGNFIASAPTETISELSDTYWFIRRNNDKLWRSNVCISTPFPGTAFWFDSVKRGIIPENFDKWEVLDLNFDPEKTIYMNDQYSKEEFAKIFPLFLETNVHASVSKQNFILATMQEEYVKLQFTNLSQRIPAEAKVLEISGLRESIKDFLTETEVNKIKSANGDVELPEEKYIYDYVVIPYTLEQFRNPEEVLRRVKPLLKENGQLVILNYNIRHISIFLELVMNRWNSHKAGTLQKKHLSFFSSGEIKQTLRNIGYTDVMLDTAEQDVSDYAQVYNNFLSLFGKYLNLERYIKESNVGSFFVTCSANNKKKDIAAEMFKDILSGV